MIMVFAAALYSGAKAEANSPVTGYVVAPGDNLWSIVNAHYPSTIDPRVKVEEIRAANNLEDSRIHPGTRLKLPPTY